MSEKAWEREAFDPLGNNWMIVRVIGRAVKNQAKLVLQTHLVTHNTPDMSSLSGVPKMSER
jgi:hypothetical protein